MRKLKNTYRRGKNYATVTIGSESNRYVFKIDNEDVDLIRDYQWKIQKINNGYKDYVYAVTDVTVAPKTRKRFYLHRFLLNPVGEQVVDHINFDTTDCRRSNMRLCTFAENLRHSRKRPRGKGGVKPLSKYKGVGSLGPGYWKAGLTYKGKYYYGGAFTDELEAARKADELMKMYHGEFACLNFPEAA